MALVLGEDLPPGHLGNGYSGPHCEGQRREREAKTITTAVAATGMFRDILASSIPFGWAFLEGQPMIAPAA